MIKRVQAFLQLIRPKDFLFLVLAYSLLGITVAQGEFGTRFILLCAANFCAVAFSFIYNQLADAPADTFDENASSSNPIAQGKVLPAAAAAAAFVSAALALALFGLLDWRLLPVGLILLSLGALYSSPGTRVRGISMLDLAGHSWLLAPAVSASGYLAFQPRFTSELLFLLLAVTFLSLLGEITREQSALSKLNTLPARQTVLNISPRAARFLILLCSAGALLSGVILLFFLHALPLRAVIFILICAGILLIPNLLKLSRQTDAPLKHLSLYAPLEKAVALGLLVEYLTSFLIKIISW